MKHRISIMLLSALALVSPRVFAATITLLPGESIQAAVTAANPGDQLIIKAGNYTGFTSDKHLDIRREQNATVNIVGHVTFSGVTQLINFAHFNVTGNLIFTNSKVYVYDCNVTGEVTSTSSNWTMQETTLSGTVTSTTSDTKVLRSNIGGHLLHESGGDTNCTVFQSTVGDLIRSKAKRTWIGYNTAKRLEVTGDDALEAEIVGNDFNRIDNAHYDWIIVLFDAANLKANFRNNKVRNCWGTSNSYECDGVQVRRGVKIRIHNNIFHRLWRLGVYVLPDNTQECEIVGNFFTYIRENAVNAPQAGVTCNHNWWWSNGQINSFAAGGVTATDTGTGDPKFVAYNNDALSSSNDYTLQGDSPLKNAGSPLLQFKDHDGTRQDIGLYGGHHYDANGTTASRPVILSAELAPMHVQKGVTDTVIIRSRAAVSTPKQ